MKGPGSKALRKGRKSIHGARYLITKNAVEGTAISLILGENPEFLINWFLTVNRWGWMDLFAFVVMPDHYHLVITLGKEASLSEALGKIDENASRLIKRAMKSKEVFWQDGFHDHMIRETEDVRKYIEYVHMNPVEAGVVEKPEDWPFSSAHPKYVGVVQKP